MANSDDIILKLRTDGFRITPARQQILKNLSSQTSPVSALDLLNGFAKINHKVNKTTIYRELDFLLSQNIIHEVEFGDGKKRYELNTGHHHHLICLNCKKVEDVDLDVDLHDEEKKIEKETGFKIDNHSLEFFGYCKTCQKKLSA